MMEVTCVNNYNCIYYTHLSYHHSKYERAGNIKHVVMHLGHL